MWIISVATAHFIFSGPCVYKAREVSTLNVRGVSLHSSCVVRLTYVHHALSNTLFCYTCKLLSERKLWCERNWKCSRKLHGRTSHMWNCSNGDYLGHVRNLKKFEFATVKHVCNFERNLRYVFMLDKYEQHSPLKNHASRKQKLKTNMDVSRCVHAEAEHIRPWWWCCFGMKAPIMHTLKFKFYYIHNCSCSERVRRSLFQISEVLLYKLYRNTLLTTSRKATPPFAKMEPKGCR